MQIKDWGYWYLAHPYKPDHMEQFAKCVQRTAQLMDYGLLVYSPIVHCHPPSRLMDERPSQWWYEYDLKIMWVGGFTGIILCDGWENSTGCKIEEAWFAQVGKKIVLFSDMLLALSRNEPENL